jgi:hypothetical protein
MIQPYRKGKDISVMMWSAIHGNGRSDVVNKERDPDSEKSGYTSNSYLTVLSEQIIRTWQPGTTFMQDNARIHTAEKVKKWFEDEGIPVSLISLLLAVVARFRLLIARFCLATWPRSPRAESAPYILKFSF